MGRRLPRPRLQRRRRRLLPLSLRRRNRRHRAAEFPCPVRQYRGNRRRCVPNASKTATTSPVPANRCRTGRNNSCAARPAAAVNQG